MNGTFNGQILVDKLAKLNNSQQSIETLSHWCIFHRKKAKQVVETWERQFHISPQEQRVAFLYLANDILQNSRRKGLEFVGEFWKVLPDALKDVLNSGDEFGKNAALRLMNIWEERKVFGSKGQILKEELVGRNLDGSNRNGNTSSILKQRMHCEDFLEKIISSFEVVYNGSANEDALLSKCKTAIDYVEKMERDSGNDYNSGPGVVEELQGQNVILRECVELLKSSESSRAVLVSQLKGFLQEQELKLEHLRNQIQVAQSRSDLAEVIYQKLLDHNGDQTQQKPRELTNFSSAPSSSFVPETPFTGSEKEQYAPVMKSESLPYENDYRKTAAAAMAAKLAASTSSTQMLTFVLSSLASEGIISNNPSESSSPANYPPEKRARVENGSSVTPYTPTQISPKPPPPSLFQHPESLPPPALSSSSSVSQLTSTLQPPILRPLLPHMVPMPPPPVGFVQNSGSMSNVPYSYGAPPPPLPHYPRINPPLSTGGVSLFPPTSSPYQNYKATIDNSKDNFFPPPPLPTTQPPISRP